MKIENIYSPQNFTVLPEYHNIFKGICQDTVSNLSTFLIVNSLKNTCHQWQLYHTIEYLEKSHFLAVFLL